MSARRPVAARASSAPPPDPHRPGDIGPASRSAWLTAREAAAHLRVSLRTIEAWTAAGVIPAHRLGPRLVRYRAPEIDAWAIAQPRPAAPRHRGGPR